MGCHRSGLGRQDRLDRDPICLVAFTSVREVENRFGVGAGPGDQEGERLAPTRNTGELYEGDIVAAGEDPDLR